MKAPWHWRPWRWQLSNRVLIRLGVLYMLITSTLIGIAVYQHNGDLSAIGGEVSAIHNVQTSDANGRTTTAQDARAINAGITAAETLITNNHLSGVQGQQVICATLNGIVVSLGIRNVPTCVIPTPHTG